MNASTHRTAARPSRSPTTTRVPAARGADGRAPPRAARDRRAAPRLSWQVGRHARGGGRRAYEVEATRARGGRAAAGWRAGDSRARALARPAAAVARARPRPRARLGRRRRRPPPWIGRDAVEAGLLDAGRLDGRVRRPRRAGRPGADRPAAAAAPRVRACAATSSRARLYATAHGLVRDWSSTASASATTCSPRAGRATAHRLRYQTYDVTALLRPGANAIGAQLGRRLVPRPARLRRRRAEHLRRPRRRCSRSSRSRYADGRRERVAHRRRAGRRAPGRSRGRPLRRRGLRRTPRASPGWSSPGYDARGWAPVERPTADDAAPTLVAPTGPPVRCTEELAPVAVTTADRRHPPARLRPEPRRPAADLGRRRRPATGSRCGTPRCSQDGELCIRPLRDGGRGRRVRRSPAAGRRGRGSRGSPTTASATPRSTGWPGELGPGDVVAARLPHRHGAHRLVRVLRRRCSTACTRTSSGACAATSSTCPTDCPQRDERLGWTGDLQVFAPTASFLYDCAGMLAAWLRDLAAETGDDGTVPLVRPRIVGDAAVAAAPTAPPGATPRSSSRWVLYQRFGDVAVLAAAVRRAPGRGSRRCAPAADDRDVLWDTGCSSATGSTRPRRPTARRTPAPTRYLVATAYFAHSARLLARQRGAARQAGGRRALRRRWPTGDRRRSAREYVTPSGRVRQRHADGVRARARGSTCSRPRSSGGTPAAGSPSWSRAADYRIGTGFAARR